MYYIKIESEDTNKLIYYCRKCGNEDKNINTTKSIIKETINEIGNNNINSFVNKYTKYDNTLPRINYIKCPNSSCSSNKESFDSDTKEIIYIRYDNINMKYLYLCSHCDFTWKTDK
jgi:DNA-directed RNA polymerase subunit M/transcription elongation factor TFIIS